MNLESILLTYLSILATIGLIVKIIQLRKEGKL